MLDQKKGQEKFLNDVIDASENLFQYVWSKIRVPFEILYSITLFHLICVVSNKGSFSSPLLYVMCGLCERVNFL